jgi:hypothetical protein
MVLNHKGKPMKSLALPFLVALFLAATISPFAASAQNVSSSVDIFSSSAPSTTERAALDLPSLSSSSAPDMFAASSRSGAAAQTVNNPEGSSRAFSSLGVGVKLGTQGIGFDVATPLVPGRLNLRGGATFFSYSTTATTDNININGTLKMRNASVMLDLFPFAGWFRISGGMSIYNNTGLTASLAVPSGDSFTLGNTQYYSASSSQGGPVTGNGTFKFGGNVAGRVTIGTGNMAPRKGHFRFESEVGVQIESSPTVAYTITGNACTSSPTTGCGPVAQSDITAEQNKLENDLKDLRFYPIVSLGLSYKLP